MKKLKKIFSVKNIHAFLLLALATAEIVLMVLYRSFSSYMIYSLAFLNILAIVFIRFAYPLAWWGNRWDSTLYRRSSDPKDDEPSDWAIISLKIFGYFVLILTQIFMII